MNPYVFIAGWRVQDHRTQTRSQANAALTERMRAGTSCLRNASPHKGVRRSPIYFSIERRDMRMLDEIILDLAPLEGRLRSLGAEARQLLRATPPARGRGTTRQPGAPARRGVLALANDSPILYIHCAYGNGRFQDTVFPARGAFRQAVRGVRREESRRGRVAARSHGR